MMTGPPTQAAILVSACMALCKSQPEKSEATRDDEADPAHPHRYRPVPDHDWPVHINPHQVEQRHHGEDYPSHNGEHFLIHWRSSHVFIQVALKGPPSP